jgi:hypothetical protein
MHFLNNGSLWGICMCVFKVMALYGVFKVMALYGVFKVMALYGVFKVMALYGVFKAMAICGAFKFLHQKVLLHWPHLDRFRVDLL